MWAHTALHKDFILSVARLLLMDNLIAIVQLAPTTITVQVNVVVGPHRNATLLLHTITAAIARISYQQLRLAVTTILIVLFHTALYQDFILSVAGLLLMDNPIAIVQLALKIITVQVNVAVEQHRNAVSLL